MTTARTLITRAMLKAGILTKSEVPAADEINDGLASLNAMLSSWSTDSLAVRARVIEAFNVSGGVGSYTIGTGQTFNTTAPSQIIAAVIRWNSYDYPLEIISDTNYQNFAQWKDSQGLPKFLNYNNAWPTGTITLFPEPDTGYQLIITSEKDFNNLTLDTDVNLGAGWERAIIYNLAVELAPEYGQDISPAMKEMADKSYGAIKRQVARARSMDAQPLYPLSNSNIYTGYYL